MNLQSRGYGFILHGLIKYFLRNTALSQGSNQPSGGSEGVPRTSSCRNLAGGLVSHLGLRRFGASAVRATLRFARKNHSLADGSLLRNTFGEILYLRFRIS
jgi:hypothetical protein